MDDKIKEQCLIAISNFVKQGKIVNVKLDGVDVYNPSLATLRDASTILLSKKYLELFVNTGLIDTIHKNFIDSPRQHLIITDKGKVKDYNITIHAIRQFLRRYLIVNEYSIMQKHLSSSIKDGFQLIEADIADILFKQDYNNPIAIDLFISFLKTATTNQKISSARDQRELKKRSDRYENSTYMFSHPFMFVMCEGTITTAELSSQSFDCRDANKIASIDVRWKKFFEPRMLGV